ncbi:MAG: hypothetical protein HY287_07765 [Planctomycetes bacterium]|nr:hypothetical protein [Planctomycetota bacterium]MBI3834208.1 hypothetical protein [Planctomycetota bacterium]
MSYALGARGNRNWVILVVTMSVASLFPFQFESSVLAMDENSSAGVAEQGSLAGMLEFQRVAPNSQITRHQRMPLPPPRIDNGLGGSVPAFDAQEVVGQNSTSFIQPNELGSAEKDFGIGTTTDPTPPAKASFPGIADDHTFFPPDTNGAVGPRHIAELLNTGFVVFGRDGAALTPQITLQAFWSSLGTGPGFPASAPYDPHIIFDQYTNRWLVVSASNGNRDDGTPRAWLLIGASTSDDPTDDWSLFAVPVAPDAVDGLLWADFPQVGVDPNNLIVTANMFSIADPPGFSHADVWVFNKLRLFQGGALVQGTDFKRVHNPGSESSFSLQPCHTYGQTSTTAVNYLVYERWTDPTTKLRRFLRFQQISGVGASALVNNFGGDNWLEVHCYNFCLEDAPQPGCSDSIAVNETTIASAVVRDGKIWATHTVGVGCVAQTAPCGVVPYTKPEIAWYEINPATIGAFPSQTAARQGRISDDSLYMYFPSIAVNSEDGVGIGFTGSSETQYAGGWFAERLSTDPIGTLRPPTQFAPGQAPYLRTGIGGSENRWGDYSATVVDPADDLTIWTIQEYAALQSGADDPAACDQNAGRWSTQWAAWTIPVATGDCNGNQQHDLFDFSRLAICLEGPGTLSVSGECACVNLDNDFDVDIKDLAIFLRRY